MAKVALHDYPQATPTATEPLPVYEGQGTLKEGTSTATRSPTDLYNSLPDQFKMNTTIDPAAELEKLRGLLPPPPTITPPTVAPAQIELPGGSYSALRSSLYNAQAGPVLRELDRQGTLADERLSAQLAQAGLADSGTGVGQRGDLLREVQQRQEDASRDISEAATARALEAQIQVISRNAELDQQARLANAGFDYNSQVENAKNILAGNSQLAQGYLNVLGVSAQEATAYRSAFLNFLSEAERNEILKDQNTQQAYAAYLNAMIQREKIASDRNLALQELDLNEMQMKVQDELARDQMAQQQGQFEDTQRLAKVETLGGLYPGFAETPAGTAITEDIFTNAGIQRPRTGNRTMYDPRGFGF